MGSMSSIKNIICCISCSLVIDIAPASEGPIGNFSGRDNWSRNHFNIDNPAPVRHRKWTPKENQILKQKYQEFGKQWDKIAEFLPHRTDNQCKAH
jgi:hypothetical protein